MLITNSIQSKTKLLINCQDKIQLDDTVLEFSETVKYLGVIVDYRLMFDEHIKYSATKNAKKTGYMMRIGKYLSKWSKKTVFNTIVAPHCEYCASIYLGPTSKISTNYRCFKTKLCDYFKM
jgi:hypothetical protein